MIHQFPDTLNALFIVETRPGFGQTVVTTGTIIRLKCTFRFTYSLQNYTEITIK